MGFKVNANNLDGGNLDESAGKFKQIVKIANTIEFKDS